MSIFIFSRDNPIRQSFYTGENSTVEDEEAKLCTEELPVEWQPPCLGSAHLNSKSHKGENEAQLLFT